MVTICHFSTDHVAPERRLGYWNDCAAATFAGMSVDADKHAFSAEMTRWCAGDLVMARPSSSRSIVRRAANPGGEERVLMHLQRRGAVHQRHLSREQVLRPGDLSICTTAAPLSLAADDHEMLVVQAWRAPLEQRLPDIDSRMGCLVDGTSPAVRILHDFVLSLWREQALAADTGDWEPGLAEVMYDLVALAVGSPRTPEPRLSPADDLPRLKALVEARLGDPDLGGPALADELGVSLRWVQHLFARAATTPRAYILARRLERAADRLSMKPGLPITELAFDLGFNDSAYFARCFRRRYGVSPSSWAMRASR